MAYYEPFNMLRNHELINNDKWHRWLYNNNRAKRWWDRPDEKEAGIPEVFRLLQFWLARRAFLQDGGENRWAVEQQKQVVAARWNIFFTLSLIFCNRGGYGMLHFVREILSYFKSSCPSLYFPERLWDGETNCFVCGLAAPFWDMYIPFKVHPNERQEGHCEWPFIVQQGVSVFAEPSDWKDYRGRVQLVPQLFNRRNVCSHRCANKHFGKKELEPYFTKTPLLLEPESPTESESLDWGVGSPRDALMDLYEDEFHQVEEWQREADEDQVVPEEDEMLFEILE